MEQKGLYRTYIKRLLDIVLSMLSLIALSPVLLITAILVRINLGSPVIFKQPRPGKDEKIFHLYKFRSMTNEVGEDGRILPDAQRLTKFGKFLRVSSLDELMELVNIIKGDMSIVGPRPLSIYYLPHYPSDMRHRHDVRPGLTGLAQIHGRNNLPWDDRFAMDIQYVEKLTFRLDVKIVLDTVMKVLKHSGVAVRGANQVKDYGPYCVLKEEAAGGKQVGGMTYSEVGSYFWLEDVDSEQNCGINWLPIVSDSCYTFSGRNAIDVAVRDILTNHKINTVYVPSYCCISMLQAFIDREMKIEFYEVKFKNGLFTYELPKADKESVVLIMSYFGLETKTAHTMIEKIHKTGAVIIEDASHSLFCSDAISEHSDYIVVALRKWFGIPTGGWVGKKQGKLVEKPTLDSNHAVEDKIVAMKEKRAFLEGKVDTKDNFLLAQAKFDNDLIHVDRMLKIDDESLKILESIDVDKVKDTRRKNVRTLLRGLQDLDDRILSIPSIDLKNDVPIFLPVFIETEKRDSLRKYLIHRGVYCPIHWPEVMGATVGVRANELSLICDQRYCESDMQVIVDLIHEWNTGS